MSDIDRPIALTVQIQFGNRIGHDAFNPL